MSQLLHECGARLLMLVSSGAWLPGPPAPASAHPVGWNHHPFG
jgi:hypothetical protein